MSATTIIASLLRRLGRGYMHAGRRLALVATLLLVTATAVVAEVGHRIPAQRMVRRMPAYAVLEVRFTTTNPPADRVGRRYILWTDPATARARLVSSTGPTLYYQRDRSGAWYVTERSGAGRVRTRIATAQAPSLLTLVGVQALFARLRRSAAPRTLTYVGLGRRMAVTFVTPRVTWPYLARGPVRVWLDAITDLPLQFRATAAVGLRTAVYITTVDSLVSSR